MLRNFSEIFGKQRDVIALNFGAFRHFLRVALVMGERMVRLGNADLRIGAAGLLASVHERSHTREVGLVGQQLQVI